MIYLLNEHHDETKDPRETNGDKDRKVYSHFLPLLLFVGLGGTLEGIVNLSCNKEEDDGIGWDNDETWKEEAEEDGQALVHVTTGRFINKGKKKKKGGKKEETGKAKKERNKEWEWRKGRGMERRIEEGLLVICYGMKKVCYVNQNLGGKDEKKRVRARKLKNKK